MPYVALRGINKTAWGAKLILTADLVYQVSRASLGHLLKAQHCHLCLNIDSISVIIAVEKKLSQKPGAFKWLVELAMKY